MLMNIGKTIKTDVWAKAVSTCDDKMSARWIDLRVAEVQTTETWPDLRLKWPKSTRLHLTWLDSGMSTWVDVKRLETFRSCNGLAWALYVDYKLFIYLSSIAGSRPMNTQNTDTNTKSKKRLKQTTSPTLENWRFKKTSPMIKQHWQANCH